MYLHPFVGNVGDEPPNDRPMTRNDTVHGEGSEEQRGVVEVSTCVACSNHVVGDDRFCSDECERIGEVDETPL